MKITKRQLRKIIKEEKTKILKEMNGPGAQDPRYMEARAIFSNAAQSVVSEFDYNNSVEELLEMAQIKSDLAFAAFLEEALYGKSKSSR